MAGGTSFVEYLPTNDNSDAIKELLEAEYKKHPTVLSLNDKQIKSLPSEIGMFKDCERLGLANNLLSVLPLEVADLSLLRYLNLKNNKLREFPPVMHLARLEVLVYTTNQDLSRNKIRNFPAEFSSSLKVLSVSRNRISYLPKYIGTSNLKVLKLGIDID
jgi:Leucine-rich repeat (LRR) protein